MRNSPGRVVTFGSRVPPDLALFSSSTWASRLDCHWASCFVYFARSLFLSRAARLASLESDIDGLSRITRLRYEVARHRAAPDWACRHSNDSLSLRGRPVPLVAPKRGCGKVVFTDLKPCNRRMHQLPLNPCHAPAFSRTSRSSLLSPRALVALGRNWTAVGGPIAPEPHTPPSEDLPPLFPPTGMSGKSVMQQATTWRTGAISKPYPELPVFPELPEFPEKLGSAAPFTVGALETQPARHCP